MLHRVLADLVLVIHAGFILFVVGGLVLILAGTIGRWRWVRHFWFRLTHLLAIAIVIVQSLLGVACPLTTWENRLRIHAGQQPYADQGFIAHWLHALIFFDAEPWVFAIGYTIFGMVVAAAMILNPPRRPAWMTH